MGDTETDFIHVRIPIEWKHDIQKKVEAKEYRDITAFVLEALDEKLNPDKREKELRKSLLKLLDDPEVCKKIQRK